MKQLIMTLVATMWNSAISTKKPVLINRMEKFTFGFYFLLLLAIFSPFFCNSNAYHPYEYQSEE